MRKKYIKGMGGLWDGWFRSARIDLNLRDQKELALTNNYHDLIALGRILKKQCPDLFYGKHDSSPNEKMLNAIQGALQKKTSTIRYRRRIQLLIRGIQIGNQEDLWSITPPPPVQLVRRDVSPLTPENLKKVHALRPVVTRFKCSLEQTQSLTLEQRIGQILASGILYGGLLNQAAASTWLGLMPDHCYADEHAVWIDFPVEFWSKQKRKSVAERSGQIHRWIPDPITQLLLLQAADDGIWSEYRKSFSNGRPPRKPWTLIKQFFSTVPDSNCSASLPFRSISAFISASRIRMALHIRPFLLEYTCGNTETRSLPAKRWISARNNRKIKLPAEVTPELDANDQLSTRRQPPTPPTPPASPHTSQVQLYRLLTKALKQQQQKKKKKSDGQSEVNDKSEDQSKEKNEPSVQSEATKKVRKVISEHESEFFPLIFALAQWAIWGLNIQVDKRSRWRASTVYRYITALGVHFASHVPNCSIDAITPDEYLSFYERIIDAPKRSARSRLYALRRLRHFHAFLVSYYDAPFIQDELWEDDSGTSARIAVNLVTASEYWQAHTLLQSLRANAEPTACEALLILGYRCGLRRSECRSLRRSDLILHTDKAYVSIENSWLNRLKSPAARRRIPLKFHMTPGEIQLLKQWKGKNFSDTGQRTNRLLFPDPSNPVSPRPDVELFDPVQRALRKVSGDPSITFHTLRHSFANRTLLLLLGIDAYKDLHLKGFVDDEVAEIRHARDALIGKNRTTRPALYSLGLQMGHADPATTLKHYLHNLDLVLAYDLQRAANPLPIAAAEKLLGISKSVLYRYAKPDETNLIDPVRLLEARLRSSARRRGYTDIQSSSQRKHKPMEIALRKPSSSSPDFSWERIAVVLKRCPTLKALDNAPSDIPEQDVAHARTAIRISKLKNRRGNQRHRLVPWKPSYQPDGPDYSRYFARLNRLKGRQETLVLWGVKQYLSKVSRNKQIVHFSTIRDAYRYCKFLTSIGVHNNEIHIVHYPNPISDISKDHQIEKWRSGRVRLFQIKPGNDIAIKAPHGRHGSIGIKVVHSPANNKNRELQASYGFRYAIHTWAVINLSKIDPTGEFGADEDSPDEE